MSGVVTATEGEGTGSGAGEPRLEALRFAWPGRSLENMLEGAMAAGMEGSAACRSRAVSWRQREGPKKNNDDR